MGQKGKRKATSLSSWPKTSLFSCPWTSQLPSSQALNYKTYTTDIYPWFPGLQTDWIIPCVSSFQRADFSVSITMWANASDLSSYACLSTFYWLCLSGEPWQIHLFYIPPCMVFIFLHTNLDLRGEIHSPSLWNRRHMCVFFLKRNFIPAQFRHQTSPHVKK